MIAPERGDAVKIIGGVHRGLVGLYVKRRTYGGETGYVEVHVRKPNKKDWRVLQINEHMLALVDELP